MLGDTKHCQGGDLFTDLTLKIRRIFFIGKTFSMQQLLELKLVKVADTCHGNPHIILDQ
jgi:hypothetical protein